MNQIPDLLIKLNNISENYIYFLIVENNKYRLRGNLVDSFRKKNKIIEGKILYNENEMISVLEKEIKLRWYRQ